MRGDCDFTQLGEQTGDNSVFAEQEISMSQDDIRKAIADGDTVLGVEFGSTRIKAVLVDAAHAPIASGSHAWENRLEHGIWTYPLEEVWALSLIHI